MVDGLVFYWLNEWVKVFIEYLFVEKVWVLISVFNFMFINCFWVLGRYKNNGYVKYLLDKCVVDVKVCGMDGIVYIVGKKKFFYLSDK